MYNFTDYSSAALVKTRPRPHLLSALTVGVCKGQGDTERVEGGRAEMDTAGASKGYTNEVIIIYYSIHTMKLTGTWREQGFLFFDFPF